MATIPIPIFSQKETFYVPQFEVYVGDKKLNPSVMSDVLQVTYKDSVNALDSFTIEINNWDADKRTFKFAPPQKGYEGTFDAGRDVEIRMGYYKNMRQMMRGVITTLEPNFPESSPSTLSISGLGTLHKYRKEEHTDSWLDGKKTDTDIAKDLCSRPVMDGKAGLGLAIDVNPSPNEKPNQVVYMKNKFDIDFLMELAKNNGYQIYLEDENDPPTLFFGQSEDVASKPVYQLEWGKSLISFRPTFATSDQFGKVVVRSWDRKANDHINEPYTLANLWDDEKKTQAEIGVLTHLAAAFKDRTKIVAGEPVHTTTEARIRARGILADINHRMITASGATVGLPDLRTGCNVEIIGFAVHDDGKGKPKGMSNCFDGEYFVESSTHTIGGGGYRTEFTARRTGDVTGREDAPQ
jgi:phage protein D